MTDVFHQLGELFLEAVPTVVLVFLFYLFLRWSFFTPIEKAMGERAARIEGARAEAVQFAAEAKQELDTYNQRLMDARRQIFLEQERAREAALEERSRLLKAMRARTQEEVAAAKQRIAKEFANAQREVEGQVPELAAQIARSIIERPSRLGGVVEP
jgi:F0F1-type ATP synthase membrane subunit b/b'